MATYSDTTKMVIAAALESLASELPTSVVQALKKLGEDGALQDIGALEKALALDLEQTDGD